MAKIKCPKCGEVFSVDDSTYAEILSQVKTNEFEKELSRRVEEIEKQNKTQLELVKEQTKNSQEKTINELKEKIQNLESDIKLKDIEKKNEIDKLNEGYGKDLLIKMNDQEREKDRLKEDIARLKSEIVLLKQSIEGEINKAVNEKEKVILELNNDIASKEKEYVLKEQSLKDKYKEDMKMKDEQIAFYKDLKAKSSTKLLGETLEQHCLNSFNSIRMTSYPNAYFEKDNDVVEGTKGDFVFRDKTDEGAELISIMFEMKNEADETATKHKNEDFYKKLDEDRKKKGCEYAVLVSTLEPDNDYFNAGIVDVSYRYPKMYVVRPQCFLPIISLLYNAAKQSAGYKNELMVVKNQNLDITNFETAVKAVAQKINADYENASKQYDTVEKICNDAIKKLEDLKEAYRLTKKWIGAAQNQLPDLEIRKLTKNNPTMKAKFEAIDNKPDTEE